MSQRNEVPLYKNIYNDIKKKIIDNVYQRGSTLPSERELSEYYNVERATVRRALELLVSENFIDKKPGFGSVVLKYLPEEKQNADSIAFVMPGSTGDKISEPFNAALFYNFEKECNKHGYNLIYYKLNKDNNFPSNLLSGNFAGIIWISKIPNDTLEKAKMTGIPSVLVSNDFSGIKSILCDNESGTTIILKYLLDLGHKRIAMINGRSNYLNAAQRFENYKKFLLENNLEFDNSIVMAGDWSFESGYNSMHSLLKQNKNFTAVFSANDMMALGAIKAAHDLGFDVPGDISVVGFDNIDNGKYSSPPLTTIGFNMPVFAKQIMRSLQDIIAKENSPVKILIPAELIERQSCRKI